MTKSKPKLENIPVILEEMIQIYSIETKRMLAIVKEGSALSIGDQKALVSYTGALCAANKDFVRLQDEMAAYVKSLKNVEDLQKLANKNHIEIKKEDGELSVADMDEIFQSN